MSRRIPSHIVDEIMSTSRIEEVIGDFVQLKRAGSNYKALSPFTEEKTPSFMVSPAKQIFKCFSTGKGGTVVTFLMELEQFSYPEALRWLADRYNIEVPEARPLSAEEQQALTERESLQIINTFARDFFVDTIKNSEEGKTVGYSYFKERGFTDETIEKFQLGYSPYEEKSLTETAIEKGYKQEYLETLGLTKTSGNRRFDFFSGRVIFPIHSVSGKVLGFGGRTLRTDKKIAKYFNSPESVLYDKSSILYGIYFAKNEIVKYDNCLLVEGYTDVISMSQAGVENVVSTSGTSLTIGQIKLIQRYTQNVTILFDSDPAGIKASFRGIDLLLQEGLNVKVLLFPEGDDPDSFAKRVSTEELRKFLDENQQDFVNFKSDILLGEAGDDPIQRANLIKEIVGSISLIPDSITRSVYIKQTADKFELQEETLISELNRARRSAQNQRSGQAQRGAGSFQPPVIPPEIAQIPVTTQKKKEEAAKRDFRAQEQDLIRILVLYGSRAIEVANPDLQAEEKTLEVSVAELIIHEVERDELKFEHAIFQDIFDTCKKGLDENIFYESKHFLRSENSEIVSFITDILTSRYEISSKWLSEYNIETTEEIHQLPQAVEESLYMFKNSTVLRRIDEIREELKALDNSDEKINDLLLEQIQLERVRGAIAEQLKRIIF